MAAVVEVGAWWAVLFAVTVVAVGPLNTVELAVAVAAAAGAALAARWVRLAAGATLGGTGGAARALALLPWSLLRGCGLLAAAMLGWSRRTGGRPASGAPAFRRTAMREGTGAGWAGLVMAASADTCVVRATDDGLVEVHALGIEPGPVERALTEEGGQR
ncbi:hypothetical protein V2S66_33660 [Streptomyces sp. V4-01]|uniref:Uncharacterized protein n=1 Tax=Actinacidiphila polyblastidii TaxID=3110430 RepID=A0ABU7PM30_9ACTN|nr:hypothetical protein [Streptomyces sp. V4-01]